MAFDAESVTDPDASGADALADLITELRGDGISFVLARSRTALEAQLARSGHEDLLPPEARYPTARDAAVAAVSGDDFGG